MIQRRDEHMGRVLAELEIVNRGDVIRVQDGTLLPEKVRRFQLQGVVNTGAAQLSLPEDVVKRLGLPKIGDVTVRYADGHSATRDLVEDAQVELLGRHGTFRAIVEPNRTTALIGAIVLEDLDLLVDCQNQSLQPRDPARPVYECE